jgi:hypothetical protein
VAGGRSGAIQIVRQKHPRFLNPEIPWLPKKMSEAEVRSVTLDRADAQLAVARWYDFESWSRLAEYVEAVTRSDSPVSHFEAAVEAVIDGNVAALTSLLRDHPDLVHARSTRVTPFDPPGIGPRCSTTWAPTASKATGRRPRALPLTWRRGCSRVARRQTRSRTCTADTTRP